MADGEDIELAEIDRKLAAVRRPNPYEKAASMEQDFVGEELLQIPTFTELTTPHVEAHAAELRHHFVPAAPITSAHILRFETQQYFESSGRTARTDQRERKVVLKVKVVDLGLDAPATAKLIALVGHRYTPDTDILKLVGRRYPTAEMNKEYLKQLLTNIVVESKVPIAGE